MNQKIKTEYHYLTKTGALKELNKTNTNLEKKTFLVLDSSVCLDLVNIVNKKNISKDSKRKAFELIKYSQKKSMHPFEIFALLELSLDKSTYKLDTDKFLDLSNKLIFAFKYPLEKLKKNDFNFSNNFFQLEKPILNNEASVFVEQILVHYCALLKIREIANKGLGKQKAKKNILEFIDWMNSELGLILGLEYQLAFQIFGGNNNFNSMIKESANKEKTLKALWGSSWDLLHARLSRNSKQLSEIVDEDVNSIFVTNDKRLFELLSPKVEYFTEFDRTRIIITDGEEDYPPHFDEDFLTKLNKKFIDIFNSRAINKVKYPDDESIKNMIEKMEKDFK